MNKLLLLFVLLSSQVFGQTTAIPDSAFELALISKGYDVGPPDGSVLTANISSVIIMQVVTYNISDLTGIQDFTALTSLDCSFNQLTSLDVSNNTALVDLDCKSNQLTCLDIQNGNNQNMTDFAASFNPNLTCIEVDDVAYSNANWTASPFSFDSQTSFNTDCGNPCITTGIEHRQSQNKKLLHITDLLGRISLPTPNTLLFYLYDDGSVEKKIQLER